MNIIFKENFEDKEVTCIITYKNKKFIGKSKCHEVDLDMYSSRTGAEIARTRAEIELYKYIQIEKESELRAIRHLLSCMDQGKKTNKKGNEYRLVKRQYHILSKELKDVRGKVSSKKAWCMFTINTKDAIYKRIRENRARKDK